MWDSTAYRNAQFGDWYDTARIAVPQTQVNTARYEDFDGRALVNRAAPQLAMSRADTMQINCTTTAATRYPLTPYVYAPRQFVEPGSIACSARADVSPFRIPTRFLEGSRGFFKAQHLENGRSPFTLCSTGRLGGGSCGELDMLLGDFGLNHGTDQADCPLSNDSPVPCVNRGYYHVTRDTFDQSMQRSAGWGEGWTGRPENWADRIAPGLPGGRITGFYLSFRGWDSAFKENAGNPSGLGSWDVSPMDAQVPTPVAQDRPYRRAYNARNACGSVNEYCFLGKFPCN
jgi:hypothetical protein